METETILPPTANPGGTAMPLYQGTKELRAIPMTRGDYNAYRGWTPPAGEDQSVDGYLVEYVDGGEPNDGRHTGYISWSPKDVFERAYRPIESFVDRMRVEFDELVVRTTKLQSFIASHPTYHALGELDRELLKGQLGAMSAYGVLLSLRISSAEADTNA